MSQRSLTRAPSPVQVILRSCCHENRRVLVFYFFFPVFSFFFSLFSFFFFGLVSQLVIINQQLNFPAGYRFYL